MKSFLFFQVWSLLLLLTVLTMLTPWQWWVLDSGLLASGQWWRLWFSQLAHLNSTHLLLNLMGVVLAVYVGEPKLLRRWLWPLLLWLLTATGIMLLLFTEDAYLGFSGVLYGLLFVTLWFSPYYPRWVGPMAATVVALKVLSEQVPWLASSMTSDLIGAPVMTQAHLFGWLSSLPIWAWWFFRGTYQGALSSFKKA